MTLLSDRWDHKNGQRSHVAILKCDACQTVFERRFSSCNHKNNHHFCSIQCTKDARVNGVIQEKQRQTTFERYGVDSIGSCSEFHEKAVKTCKGLYGQKLELLQQKKLKTDIKKYGCHSLLADDVVKKRESTCMSRHGVLNPFSSKEIRNKSQHTMIERFGVPFAMQNSDLVEKRRNTWVKKYGVSHPMLLSMTWKKAHETKKQNQTYGKTVSKLEKKFATTLRSVFKHVDDQVIVNDWKIDFYVGDIDTYVQFDGCYWHGLDRPIEIIAEHKTKRDVSIHKIVLQDKVQNEWFNKHNMRLIRVTDKEYKMFGEKVLSCLQYKTGDAK